MKLVIAHGNVELVKGMKKPKGSKRAKDAQEKKKTKGTQEPISRKTNGHVKTLGERVNGRPKEASRIESLWQE